MLSSSLLVSLSLAGLVLSLNIPRSAESTEVVPQGVVKLRIDTVPSRKPAFSKVVKRQTTTPLINDLKGLEYLINFQIGTPPQNLTASLDTGSSDTFVNPTCTNAQRPSKCESYAFYTPSLSTTSHSLNTTLAQSYGSGSVNGAFYSDTFTLGTSKVAAAQFGVAKTSSGFDTGLMGVGFGNIAGFNTTTYPNLVDQLALQNVTSSRAFSLDLASVSTTAGSIIFGGIDTKKYTGKLHKVPILPVKENPDKFPRYWINMSSVGFTLPKTTAASGSSLLESTTITNATQPVFLDSGSTLSMLPAEIVTGIIGAFKNVTNIGGGEYTLPCSNRNATGTIDFGFGGASGVVIKVPFAEFLWVYGSDVETGADLCALGAFETQGQDIYILGDSVLRSAFVVYDQDNANIHIAQSADCGSNLVAIGKGAGAVPTLAGAC